MPDRDSVYWRQALAGICVLAVGLRILGIRYGLPAIYNPDETPILTQALALGQDLKPRSFADPSLHFYLLFIWEGLYFVGGRALGVFGSLGDFQRAFFVDPSRHFLVGRALSVLCGTLTVVAVYLLGKRLYDRATGLVAAAVLAVAPIAVRDAHYVKLDIPTTMFVAFAHLALARILVDPDAAAHRRTWTIAGLLAGLAVSTEYYAIFIVFTMIGVALADLARSHNWRDTAALFRWAVAAAVVGFVLGSPFVPLNLLRVVADVAHVREADLDGVLVGGRFATIIFYLRILFLDAMGWPIWIAAVAGCIWAFVTDWRRGLLIVSFFVPFFLFIVNTAPMSRRLNVVLPMIALAAGIALVRLGRFFGSPTRFALLVTVPLIPGLISSLEWDLFLRQADTRTLAADFIQARIPSGRSFLVQPGGLLLKQTRGSLLEGLRKNLGSEANASTKYKLLLSASPNAQPSYRLIYLGERGPDLDRIYIPPNAFTPDEALEPLRRAGIEYVILKRSNRGNPGMKGLEEALAREGERIAVFSPYRAGRTEVERKATPPFLHDTAGVIQQALERPGPTVEIWLVKPAGEDTRRRWGAPRS